jgi:glycosyltransferase involved in cell wall biosynthesis
MRRAVTNLNATNRLVAVSQLAAQSYRDQGVRRSFEIIPNGVRHPEESHLDVPKEIQALTRGKTVLLTVGFFVPEKRIEYSVKTLARLHANGLKDTVLLIIGKGVLERELRKRIQQENLTDVVRIIGEVAPEDMWGYYSITDVLLHPSTVESFSMVCLEAMSYGKPIVCTSNIGLVEFLQPGRDAVVVPPDDPSALYEAVLRLVRNPSLRRTIGRRAEKTAQNLSWPAQVRKLRRTYEEMLGDVGSR